MHLAGEYESALEPALIYLAQKSMVDSNYLLTSRNTDAKRLVLDIIRKLPPAVVAERCNRVGAVIGTKTHNIGFRLSLGDVLEPAHMTDLALEQYRTALVMAPKAARGIFREGKDLEIYKHDYAQALACYAKAHDLRPNDAEITAYYDRLNTRMKKQPADLAWNLRDWLSSLSQPSKGN